MKDISKIFIGLVTTMTENYTDEGTLLIRNSDIKDNRFEFSATPIFLEESFAEKNKSRRFKLGDVVTVHTGDIGTSAVITENEADAIGFATINTRPDKNILNAQFLSTFLNTDGHKQYAIKMSTGDGRSNYNLKDFTKLVISVPEMNEQQKIGTFFKKLDDTITLHQRKLDLLKQLKQAYLQRIFPKNGEDKPEIRFSDFKEDWEPRKLGEVSEIVGGGTPSTGTPAFWEGEINWYSPAEIGDQIYVTESQKKITESGLQKSSAKILPVGAVLFTSRAGIGNTAIMAKEGSTNQGFQSILPKKHILDSYFIFSRSHELKRYGEVTGAGSTFVEVSGKQMAQMPIRIPSFDEQKRIGSFFANLDQNITLHQSKLDQLKHLKSAFLQKMFI